MKIQIRRSPTGVCWWVLVNGVLIDTACKKYEAVAKKNSYVKRMVRLGI